MKEKCLDLDLAAQKGLFAKGNSEAVQPGVPMFVRSSVTLMTSRRREGMAAHRVVLIHRRRRSVVVVVKNHAVRLGRFDASHELR